MVAVCRSLVFFNTLVKVSARVTDITYITQVTMEIIHNGNYLREQQSIALVDIMRQSCFGAVINSKMYKYIKTALQKELIPDPLHQYPHPG